MKLSFTKMEGCGNDYIYFDCFKEEVNNPEELAVNLSNRHFGIGGDGIVLIMPSQIADARMRMFNADGSEGKMCGNATRCIGKYLYEKGGVKKDFITLETLSGIKELRLNITGDTVNAVQVNMGQAILNPTEIPVNICGDTIIDLAVPVGGKEYKITCVSMGNPHAVVFCNNVEALDLPQLGPLFENHPMFPERINTEFVEVTGANSLKMRVWERGSGETLACGTGACASAVAAVLKGYCNRGEDITVELLGGSLVVNWQDDVYMTGGCKIVFTGTIEI